MVVTSARVRVAWRSSTRVDELLDAVTEPHRVAGEAVVASQVHGSVGDKGSPRWPRRAGEPEDPHRDLRRSRDEVFIADQEPGDAERSHGFSASRCR